MRRTLQSILIIIFSMGTIGVIYSQNEAQLERTNNLITSALFSDAHLGIAIARLSDKKWVESYQTDKNFIPASTLKLWFTLAAVDRLGSSFKYETRILYSGEVLSDGSLEGDLLIKSSGDPSFASDRLNEKFAGTRVLKAISQQLKKKGISCIDGDLVIKLAHRSYPIHGSWSFEDLGNYYAGGAHSFNFNENEFRIDLLSPKNKGAFCPVVEVDPAIPFLSLQSHVLTAGKNAGDNAYVYGKPYDQHREIWGSIPSGKGTFSIYASMPDPALAFAALLSGQLEKDGIQHNGFRVSVDYDGEYQQLGVHRSPTIKELAAICNDYSINLYAEAMGKSILEKEMDGIAASYPDEKQWESIFKSYNLPTDQLSIVDACGLSSQNLIRPRQMINFLMLMMDKLGEEAILEIIPQAGQDGLAKQFHRDPEINARLWLKSGSIANVVNYAGFFKSKKNDELYAFCLFSNQLSMSASAARAEMADYLADMINTL